MSPGETTLHMPVKKMSEDDSVQKTPLENTSDEVPKLQVEESTLLQDRIAVTEDPTRIVRTTSARWTSFCKHLGLVLFGNKHAKMSPRELGSVDLEPHEKYVSEGDGVWEAPLVEPPTWCQTERPDRTGTMPREKQRHWCRRRMKSQVDEGQKQKPHAMVMCARAALV